MDRLACVDVPALPLQLLLRSHPDWARHPAAVVDEDRPQGLLHWVNEAARRRGVSPGQRHAQGLSLAPELRAGVVAADEIARAVHAIADALRRLSPHVEPAPEEPGVFWLDASGLARMHPSLEAWGRAVRRTLGDGGLQAAVVVGWSRFDSYAVARSLAGSRVRVFADADLERAAAWRVPIDRIGLAPEACATLRRLAVRDVGDFLRLPAAGLRHRFGPEVHRLHRLAAGTLSLPLQPEAPADPAARSLDLDEPEADRAGLLFLSKRLLDPILLQLAARGEAVAALHLGLSFERGSTLREEIRPASPGLDGPSLLELVRLCLERLPVPAGVVRLALEATGVRATVEQLRLFDPCSRRDPRAAARAIARLRALFGNDAVVRARLQGGHLPEARFSWEPIEGIAAASPASSGSMPGLVRRLHARPLALPLRPRHEPDGWLLRGLDHGSVERLCGPYRMSGGWWRGELERDYHFARMRSGSCYWTYYDRRKKRWFLQGQLS